MTFKGLYQFLTHDDDILMLGHDGPDYHCAIGTGSQASRIKKFAVLAGLEVKKIC